MTDHQFGAPYECLSTRRESHEAEKTPTRRNDKLVKMRLGVLSARTCNSVSNSPARDPTDSWVKDDRRASARVMAGGPTLVHGPIETHLTVDPD
jgi:hypothetical protein